MSKEKFVLLSLQEDKAKELAQVISNESCRKILDYLAENNDATESELAGKLQVPISTVHYNLKHLVAGGLVSSDEYHYSQKGKEVNHYKLANKYIIIAPKSTHGIKEKLRAILPVALLGLAGAGMIQAYNTLFGRSQVYAMATTTQEAVAAPLQEGISAASKVAADEVSRAALLPRKLWQLPCRKAYLLPQRLLQTKSPEQLWPPR